MNPPRLERDRPGLPLAPLAMFATLWFVAAFYLHGQLGIWVDDWQLTKRDPATGAIRWPELLTLNQWGTRFWRPFHLQTITWLNTLLANHQNVVHLILALFHGMNTWLLWHILRGMCRSRQAAALGAMLFLVYPAGHEAIFWLSTVGTTVGTAAFLYCALGAQRLARDSMRRLELLVFIPILLTIACWYEQPAACSPLVALAYFAAAPSAVPLPRRLARAAGLGSVAVAGLAIYAVLLVSTMPATSRGGAGSFVTSQQALPQVQLILSQAAKLIALDDFAGGSLREGARTFFAKPRQAAVMLILFAASAAAFAFWWMRREPRGDEAALPDSASTPLRRLARLGFGAGIVIASATPAMVVHNQWFASRLAYLPCLGLAAVLAVAVDELLSVKRLQTTEALSRPIRAALLAALLCVSVAGALMLVGVQSSWQRRMLSDAHVAAELRRLVPDPPRDAVFVPVRVQDKLTKTGHVQFDHFCRGPFEIDCSPTPFVQRAFRRNDVYAFSFNRWAPIATALEGCPGAVADGLALSPAKFANVPGFAPAAGRRIVPWGTIVAFEVGAAGKVRLVDTLLIQDARNPALDRKVQLPLGSVGRGDLGRPALLAAAPGEGGDVVELAWRLQGPDGQANPERPESRSAVGRQFTAFNMHPSVGEIQNRDTLAATLPPAATRRRVAWRIAMPDHIWSPNPPLSDGVGVTLLLDGRSEKLFHGTLAPAMLRSGAGWVSMVAEAPPTDTPVTLRLVIDAGDAADPNTDWCMVTPPVLSSAAEPPPSTSAAPGKEQP